MKSLKVIIVGAGEVGFNIAKRLAMENKEVVVVDRNASALRRIVEVLDVQTVEGSGSSPKVLDAAGIRKADVLLAVTDSDEINIIACIFAKTLAPDIIKLARIRNDEYREYGEQMIMDILNVDMVINPDVEAVKTIEQLISLPDAEEVNEFADGRIKLIGLRTSESPLIGRRLMNLREAVGEIPLIVAAIIRDDTLIIPSGDDVIMTGDLVYFVCRERDIQAVMSHFGSETKPVRNVLIIGGGDIGLRLAQILERKGGLHVKIIERDEERCDHLAQALHKTVVLCGDGTDQDLLLEENVKGMDVVISVTGDEENNILTSLLAKNLGAPKAITRIDKGAYFPLVRAIGIENTVSPRLSAVHTILRFMRRGKVLSTTSIQGDQAEALEAIAQENSDIAGKALKDLNLPRGSLVLSIQRGEEVVFPTGDSVIHPQDRILILSTRKHLEAVEKALTVKLEYF